MFKDVSEVSMAQSDGGSPTTVAFGSAPGESGLLVFRARFQGGMRMSGTARQHHICFQLSPKARFDSRIANQALLNSREVGSLSICPAGADYWVEAEGDVDGILIAIDPGQFTLAAAEGASLEARLIERLTGFDHALFELSRRLASECANGYPNGPLFWNAMASAFVGGLLTRHTRQFESHTRGKLSTDVLDRLKEYILAHLDESIEVGALAKIAGRSPFHFTRVFARSVGATPYRYIVHLRLQRALELMCDGRSSLAEIAAATGFADQSHLSRWVRRVHGVSPTQLAA